MILLHVNNITKNFETGEGTLTVLRGVSLDLISGKSLALTGESGSGKSTLLYLIGGLDVPDEGRIEILGKDIASLNDPQRAALRRGTVGVVFQQFNLIPSLNVAANLSLTESAGLPLHGTQCASFVLVAILVPFKYFFGFVR